MSLVEDVEQSRCFIAGDRIMEKLVRTLKPWPEPVFRAEHRVRLIHRVSERVQGIITASTMADTVFSE